MIVAAAVVAAVSIVTVLAVMAMRAKRQAVVVRHAADDTWAGEAGSEFAGLSESERCDVVFAIGALEDDASWPLLERALRDSSEAVALAAAHALTRRGNGESVERYLAANPGDRASRISSALEVLGPG